MNKVKNLSKIVFGFILTFLLCNDVSAELIPINDVAEEFSKTEIITALNEWGSLITTNVNTETKKFNILSEKEIMLELNYTDEYIEYNNRDGVVTEDNYHQDIGKTLYLSGIIEAILNLNGYSDKTLSDEVDKTISYEEYGIQFESEHYEFSGTDSDGSNWKASGDYIKYFKISLDSEKIATLIEKYGVEEVDKDAIFANATATIEAKDITNNSVTLYATATGYDATSTEETPVCGIYRSTEIDGTYELISDWHVGCIGEVGITDDSLESGKTYYYKAKVLNGTNFGDVISVTTLTKTTTNTPPNKTTESTLTNPKTGSNYIYVILIFLISSIISIIFMRNIQITNKQ